MSVNPLLFVLAIPAFAAALLALLPGYRASSQVNVRIGARSRASALKTS